MALYRIADLIVSMNQIYKETESWYAPYIYQGEAEPDIVVDILTDDIDYFVKNGVDITAPISENMCLCDRFNYKLLKFYGSYIHSSALLYRGRVYLISADSGVGKSTLTARFCRLFPEAVIINDDKPSFRLIDGKCIVYGTPFAGGTPVQKNLSAELGGVIFLERGDKNLLSSIPASKAITLLLKQVKRSKYPQRVDRLMSMYSDIIENYPFYLLTCTNSDEAAYEVLKAMKQDTI